MVAFDTHRVGTHAYTYSQGARMEPVRDDGRRCLRLLEMAGVGLQRDSNGRWSTRVEDNARPIPSKPHGSIPGGDKEAAEGA